MNPAHPEIGTSTEENQHRAEGRTQTRRLNELYASDIEVPEQLQITTGDDTVITSQISDYGNDLRRDSHRLSQSSERDDEMPDAPEDPFPVMGSSFPEDPFLAMGLSFPEGFTHGNQDSTVREDLSDIDLEMSRPKAKGGLLSQLWAALITAWRFNQSKDDPSTKKFLPRNMLTKICSFEAVCNELRPHFELEVDVRRCTEYICGKKSEPKSNNRESSREIFAILVLIKAVEFMPDLVRAGIRDDDLPFTANREVDELRTRHGQLIECLRDSMNTLEFYEKQWWVHVPYLGPQGEERRAPELTFAPSTIMPWTFMDENTDEGGFGSVRKVRIHEDHHHFVPPEFALKTLTDAPYYSRRMFEQETHVLRRIGSGPHVVELCASFIIGDNYMMLFPWAEGGNLTAIWNADPPTLTLCPEKETAGRAEFVEWVARQCCGLVEVLHKFHGYFDNRSQDAEDKDHYGIHGDIKPENILYFTKSQTGAPLGTLKLADFGLARLHRAKSRSGKHWSIAGAADQTYRSPEHDTGHHSRKVDMWSLGCVFSEFCSWLIRGPGALKRYNEMRAGEQDKSKKGIWKEDSFFVKLREANCLEGGESTSPDIPKLKSTVSEWIEGLHRECACRSSPTFLQEFLDFIRCEMLHPDKEQRADCDKVKGFLAQCLKKGETDPEYWASPHPNKEPPGWEARDSDSSAGWRDRGSASKGKRIRFEQS